jgi:hypothetical protein
VFGPGGTGKTTLGQILSSRGANTPISKPAQYELSHKTEEVSPVGDLVATLFIPGGQERYIMNDWPALYQSLAKGASRGVINVVCYGYHSFSEFNFRDTKYFINLPPSVKQTLTRDGFMQLYLESRRNRELQIIRDLVPHLNTAKEDIWMLTVVTKQDLWWKDRTNAQAFYEGGEYNSLVEQIASVRGKAKFAHAYVSASLVQSNLQTNDGEVLAPTAEGYDQTLQYANLTNLLHMINTFMTR